MMADPDPIDQSASVAQLIAQAELSADNRDWELADRQFHEALSRDKSPLSRIAYGVRLAERERYFEAISIFTTVLDGDDLVAIRIVCHNLAAVYREVGDLDLARRFQWRATLMQADSGAEDVLGMASDALASHRPVVAESLAMLAIALSGDEEEAADAHLMATIGLVKAALNSTREGILTLFAAYRQHRTENDFRGMGIDLLNLATLFGDLHRHRAERSCLARAIHCFTQASAPLSCQKARLQLADANYKIGLSSFDVRRN